MAHRSHAEPRSHSARTHPTTRHSASTSRSGAMIITGQTQEDPQQQQSRMYLEPSYKLEPESHFPGRTTRDCIKEVLDPALENVKYDPLKANAMCKDLANQITARVKSLGAAGQERFKVVTFVLVGQEELGTVSLGSRCVWNAKFDTYAEYTARNGTMYAVGMVYGVYAD